MRRTRQYCTNSVVDFGAGGVLPISWDETNPAHVQMAKEKGGNVILGDVLRSGLAGNSYEVWAALEVLEHIDDYGAKPPLAASKERRLT